MRHTHYLKMERSGYTDSQLCTPPADLEGEALTAWALAKVTDERGGDGWTVTLTAIRKPTKTA
jgi:hypothetical protein